MDGVNFCNLEKYILLISCSLMAISAWRKHKVDGRMASEDAVVCAKSID
jgi:hypothetical protein